MLNLGVRAHDFGKLPLEELARRIEEKGFTSIQLALNKAVTGFDAVPGRLSPGTASYIRDTFARRGIGIAVLGCYINPIHPDLQKREQGILRFKEHIRFARDFGCSVVATETGSCSADCSYSPETEKEDAFLDFLDVVRELVEEAECFGVIVGIEGVAVQHTIGTYGRMCRLLEEVDSGNLQVVYDPVNFLPDDGQGQDDAMKTAFELFGDRIVSIHAKDFCIRDGRKDGTLPAGTGMLNYPLFFRLLKERKPLIHVLLESNSPDTMDDSIRFIRHAWEEAR